MKLKSEIILCVSVLAVMAGPLAAQPWLEFVKNPILTEDDRRSIMFSYVDRNLPVIEIPTTKHAWEQSREPLRRRILKVVGLEDLEERGPVRWISKGRIDRDT